MRGFFSCSCSHQAQSCKFRNRTLLFKCEAVCMVVSLGSVIVRKGKFAVTVLCAFGQCRMELKNSVLCQKGGGWGWGVSLMFDSGGGRHFYYGEQRSLGRRGSFFLTASINMGGESRCTVVLPGLEYKFVQFVRLGLYL